MASSLATRATSRVRARTMATPTTETCRRSPRRSRPWASPTWVAASSEVCGAFSPAIPDACAGGRASGQMLAHPEGPFATYVTACARTPTLTGAARGMGVTADVVTGAPEYKFVNPRGVLPGYKGFVPGARDKYGGSPYGGTALTPEDKRWAVGAPKEPRAGYYLTPHDGVSHLIRPDNIVHRQHFRPTGVDH